MFTSHYVQIPAVEPVYRSHHRSIEGPGLAAVCKGRAHTQTRYSRSLVVRDTIIYNVVFVVCPRAYTVKVYGITMCYSCATLSQFLHLHVIRIRSSKLGD